MTAPEKLAGRCLCGSVRYEIAGELEPAMFCHCSQCRRASGSAFATNASARADEVTFTVGRELITEYESSPGKYRGFCSRCGSPLYARRRDKPDTLRIRAGTLDGAEGVEPRSHIWVGSMAGWFRITDTLTQYPASAGDAVLLKDHPKT